MIIGISGYIGSGKDTIANIIRDHDPSWEVVKFADKLKEVAAIILGVPRKNFEDRDYKLSELPDEWNVWDKRPTSGGHEVEPFYNNDPVMRRMTVREFLQKLGTDAIRNGLHEDTWVNATMADYVQACWSYLNGTSHNPNGPYEYPKWIITDVRFPNEFDAIKKRGGTMVRVFRHGMTSSHISETALDTYEHDIYISNKGNIDDLVDKVRLSIIESIL
jgi:hypothetical protein